MEIKIIIGVVLGRLLFDMIKFTFKFIKKKIKKRKDEKYWCSCSGICKGKSDGACRNLFK